MFASYNNPAHLTQLTVSKEETEGLFVIKGENYVRKKAHKVNAVSLHYSASGGGGGSVKRWYLFKINLFHCSYVSVTVTKSDFITDSVCWSQRHVWLQQI